jgi:hypothetical protein
MTNVSPHPAALLACALLALGTASAEETGTAGFDEASYQVEIVVFSRLERPGATAESRSSRTVEPAEPASPAAGDWSTLGAADLQLTGAAARLRQLPGYRLLYHSGWSQPVQSQRSAIPYPLPEEARRAGLRGAITLYRERYLHAIVEVALDETGGDGESASTVAAIRQARRLRGAAPQYFDDPRLGVILWVRPPANLATPSAAGEGSGESAPAP